MRPTNRIIDPDLEYKIFLNNFLAFVRKYGFIRGAILWIINTLLRAIAFPSLVILRYGFGRAAMGVIILCLSFLYCNYFVLSQIPLESTSSYSNPNDLPEFVASVYWYGMQIFQNLSGIVDSILWEWKFENMVSITSFYFSFLVLGLGVFNLLHEQLVPEIIKPHVGHRGKSFFFSWIMNKSSNIDGTIFQRFIEPLILLTLGICLILFEIDINFGWLLSISSVALFFEEQRFFARERRLKDPTRR